MDISALVLVRLNDGTRHIAEFQLQLEEFYLARQVVHRHYSFLRAELPALGILSRDVDDVQATILHLLDGSKQSGSPTGLRMGAAVEEHAEATGDEEEQEPYVPAGASLIDF